MIAWRYGWIWTGPTARTRRRRGCLPHRLRLGPERGSGGWAAGEVALTRRPATSLAGGHRARLVGSGDLRSKTQGRASYSMVFDSYAEDPANVAKEIIAKATGE